MTQRIRGRGCVNESADMHVPRPAWNPRPTGVVLSGPLCFCSGIVPGIPVLDVEGFFLCLRM